MCKKTVIRRLSKLIDLNLDKVEMIKAYEEGSGFEFENQQISGGSNRQPAQLPGSDNVVGLCTGAGSREENDRTEATAGSNTAGLPESTGERTDPGRRNTTEHAG